MTYVDALPRLPLWGSRRSQPRIDSASSVDPTQAHQELLSDDPEPTRIEIKVHGEAPAELKSSVRQLNWLLNANSCSGLLPVTVPVLSTALKILIQTLQESTPTPHFALSTEGSLQIEWHEAGYDVEIRVDKQATAHLFIGDFNVPSNDWEGLLDFEGRSRLLQVIQELSKPEE